VGRLDGKVAIVTGGSNGLGTAIATRMTEEGATAAIVDRMALQTRRRVLSPRARRMATSRARCAVK